MVSTSIGYRGHPRKKKIPSKAKMSMEVVLKATSVEIVPRGYLQISFLQPIRECQRSKGISRTKILVVIV
jgi:hypothetical protein